MIPLEAYKALVLGRISLPRLLTELELRQLRGLLHCHTRQLQVGLIAGSGRSSRGSETVFTDLLARTLFADIDTARSPDVIADLSGYWPFCSDTFDVVVSTWVLEHVHRPAMFVHEAHRVLRAGGAFVCAVPFIQHIHASPCDYWRFTEGALVKLASDAGFRAIDVRPVGAAPFVSAVSLLWPILGIPPVGIVVVFLAQVVDVALKLALAILRKDGSILASFPATYVVFAIK